VEGGGFDLSATLQMLEDLEAQLEIINPGAIQSIFSHLKAKQTRMTKGSADGLDEFKAHTIRALKDAAKRERLTWHPWGSDNVMIADSKDLIDAIAKATGKQIAWSKGVGAFAAAGESSSSLRGLGKLELSVSRMRSLQNRRKRYRFFISYYRDEAGSDARLLQTRLQDLAGSRVFLDASSARDVSGGVNADEIRSIIEEGLGRSDVLVFLQTKSCLTRPWVLLELYVACIKNIPIIPVRLADGGYDYGDAAAFLADLGTSLQNANPGAVEAIETYLGGHGRSRRTNGSMRSLGSSIRSIGSSVRSNTREHHETHDGQGSQSGGSTIAEVARVLSVLPKIISVSLDPEGSENHQRAALSDILAKAEVVRKSKGRRSARSGAWDRLRQGQGPSRSSVSCEMANSCNAENSQASSCSAETSVESSEVTVRIQASQ